ncbi:family 1 glycosylhydrolase [Jatrophihabitans sp.]|uniref:family 1 glycosylhydrolase n=1 Tax=Jatrophihabitans sp. TaxID=1932789 RepID=UPI002C96196F|nr:family 1 glycosylhydrolase [Jatrophihabitans sp.]
MGRTVVGGFESTHLPAYRTDLAEATGHAERWQADLDDLLAAGVRCLRYPLRWPRIEPEPGRFDWSRTDRVLEHLRAAGAVPIVDLVHHTSYPDWLSDGFRDEGFAPALVRYAEAVARRYPWLPAYTLFNEPFATLHLAGCEGLWPPYDRGIAGFVRLARSVLPAVSRAAGCWAELLPEARHVWVDTAEHHTGNPACQDYAELANDRRYLLLDLLTGHDLDPARPYLAEFVRAGGGPLLELPPCRVDLLGLDYYCHSEWFYDEAGGHAPSPYPIGFAALAEQYSARYGLPMMLTETNLRGQPSDRVSWLRYMLEQYDLALERGVPLHGFCWFPQVDSCDWDSLLARSAGRVDPVGVLGIDPATGGREWTGFTDAWQQVVRGAGAGDLPAYRFQPPCDAQLAGLTARLDHWPWEDPPAEQVAAAVAVPLPIDQEFVMNDLCSQPDLVVLSHLRWPWVWQRPQHLVSRFARQRAAAGARTWFVEEPVAAGVDAPRIAAEERDGLTRVRLEVPGQSDPTGSVSFADPRAACYPALLAQFLAEHGCRPEPDLWLYTPMAYDIARQLHGGRLVYDVMDDLAAFRNAPEGLRLRQRQLLHAADVVFTGGRSLHRATLSQRRHAVHLFPSGVESRHYAASRSLRVPRQRKVAGYVGVIDERIDLELVASLAAGLPDWTVRLVGPVAKIDPSDLPQAANLDYLGMVGYPELPRVMAGFDVALMPFARNEATRAISPTKTLEYLAAGLPVVSTRVPDVVADYSGVVCLADDGPAFAAACREVVTHSVADRDRRVQPIQARQEWDCIASAMAGLLDRHTRTVEVVVEVAEVYVETTGQEEVPA